jgi:hypothetical protein
MDPAMAFFASMVPGNVAEEHSNMAVPFERLGDEDKQIR